MRRFLIAKLVIFLFIISMLSTRQINPAFSQQSCHPNGGVERASFSADGKFVLANWGESVARLWEVDTGKALHTFTYTPPDHFWTLALAPDNKTVAAALFDRAVVWDVKTEKIKYEFRPNDFEPDAYYGPSAFYVASKNGKELVYLVGNSISSWSVETGKLLWEIKTKLDRRWLAIPADLILTSDFGTGSEPGKLILWNAANGQMLRELKGSTLIPEGISSDGKYLFGIRWVDSQRNFIVLDSKSNKVVFTHDGSTDNFSGVDISPNGKHIIGFIEHDSVILDTRTDKMQMNLGPYVSTNPFFLPQDQILIIVSKDDSHDVNIYALDSGRKLSSVNLPANFTNPSLSADVSVDKEYLLAGDVIDPVLSLWDIRTGKLVRVFC